MSAEPIYKIGETVWIGRVVLDARPVECPDCRGSKRWTVTTVAETFEIPCPRCCDPLGRYRPRERYWRAETKRLTIGSVRTDSAAENPVTYMCRETGVGSGSVYYERELYDSEEAALAAATREAETRPLPGDKVESEKLVNLRTALRVGGEEERGPRIRYQLLLQDVAGMAAKDSDPKEVLAEIRAELEDWLPEDAR